MHIVGGPRMPWRRGTKTSRGHLMSFRKCRDVSYQLNCQAKFVSWRKPESRPGTRSFLVCSVTLRLLQYLVSCRSIVCYHYTAIEIIIAWILGAKELFVRHGGTFVDLVRVVPLEFLFVGARRRRRRCDTCTGGWSSVMRWRYIVWMEWWQKISVSLRSAKNPNIALGQHRAGRKQQDLSSENKHGGDFYAHYYCVVALGH